MPLFHTCSRQVWQLSLAYMPGSISHRVSDDAVYHSTIMLLFGQVGGPFVHLCHSLRCKSIVIVRQSSMFYATICMQLARNLVHIAGHPKRNCTPSSLAETKKADALWSIRL
ncbi:hypothetical protein SAMN02745202_00459 [Segatella oulorum]|uniref:Uncharacterized protein n=1 Tax=Segatella oulorum TaxID=28136 RepID=A0A1T4LMR1_9BACT|nr:hypothetical protein SAMN02745202_00459 [Segatella oulorum]